MRKRPVTVRFRGRDGGVEALEASLVDVFSRDGAEWLRLDSGREIRLDRLVEVDGHSFGR